MARAWLDEHGFASTVDYLVAACRLVRDETGLLPHANAGALDRTSWPGCGRSSASQGMMIESLDPDLDCHRAAPDKTPERRLATLRGGRASWPSPSPPGSWSASARPGPTGSTPWLPSPTPTGPTATSKRSSSRTSCPKRGRPCTGRRPVPTEELAWTIAVARLVLPAEIHLQAPPNLSDDLGPLLDSGIDDFGGVSPVTIDHVNPERAWPAIDILRAATEAAGLTLAPRLTLYPEFALDPSAGSTRPCASPSSTPPTPRASAGTTRGARAGVPPPHCSPCRATRLRCRCHRRRPRGGHRCPRPAARWARSWPGSPSARRSGEDEIVTLFSRPRPRGPGRGRGGRPAPGRGGGRRGHLGGQPEHQLHQRLHLQVPLLRLLQGSAVAQPPGHALSARALRHHRPGAAKPRRPGPPRSASRAGSTPSSTATTTWRSSGPCGPPRPRIHIHAFTALEVTEGAERRGAAGRLPPPAEGRRAGHPAGHGGRDPRRRGPGRSSAPTRSTPSSG